MQLPKMSCRQLVRLSVTAACVSMAMSLASCISSHPLGRLKAISKAEDPVQLDLTLQHGAYSVDPAEVSFYLSSLQLENLLDSPIKNAQILHAQLLWSPKPGSTPVDPTATNLTLRLALFIEGELGIYGGAGFAWPSGSVGKGPVELEIVGSTLTLLHSTEGFRDLLSPVLLIGRISAPFEPVNTLRFRQAASQLVTNRLGRTQWVGKFPTSTREQVAAVVDP